MAYSEKEKKSLVDEICKRVSNGEAIRNVLKDKSMPNANTFYQWIDADESKAKQYARAAEERADTLFEEILAIADTTELGTTTKTTEKGIEVTEGDMIQHRRLQVDARKWMLSKMMPKKYGDKLELANNEENPINPVQVYLPKNDRD